MAIGQSSPYASPLRYSTPMTSTPTLADIQAAMVPRSASPASQDSTFGLGDVGNVLGSLGSVRGQMQQQQAPLSFLEAPVYQQYQSQGPQNLLSMITSDYLQGILQAPPPQPLNLLDFIKLLGG